MVQKVFRIREEKMGPKLMNCCQPEPMGTQEHGNMLKRIQVLEDGWGSSKGGKKLAD